MGTKDDLLTTFPAFFRVDGRKVAIFGGGDEAFAKARLMAKTSAVIAAYAENAEDDYRAFLAEHGYQLVEDAFRPRNSNARCWCLPRPESATRTT